MNLKGYPTDICKMNGWFKYSCLNGFVPSISDVRPWVISLWTIFACFSLHCCTYFSICSIKGWPFIIERDSFVFSTLPARFQHQIQHFYGKLQSFWLMKSKDVQNNPGDPQLWRTGGVLHCCHCSQGRKERVLRTPGGKNPEFQFKRGQKAAFLYRQWESGGKPFPFVNGNNTCWLFFSSRRIELQRRALIETGQNNE